MNDSFRPALPTRRAATLLIAAGAIAAARRKAAAQGYLGLGADAQGYDEVRPGLDLVFPRDHGAHPGFRIEWWYVTANLVDASGQAYGVQWTLFRQALQAKDEGQGFASRQIYMGHAAATSASRHRFAERFARGGVGQAGVEATPLTAFIDDWKLEVAGTASPRVMAPLSLRAAGQDFSYALTLAASRDLILNGEAGYSRKSERGQASYYYSQPFPTLSGVLTLDGKAIEVTGEGWFDHEWSSQHLSPGQTGWDWFALQLNSGLRLMLYRLRESSGDAYVAGTLIRSDGSVSALDPAAVMARPTGWTSVAGRRLPTSWQVIGRGLGLDLAIRPLNPECWMGTRFPYWEGPVLIEGSDRGAGYLELTGY